MLRWRIDTRRLDDLRLSVGLLLPACAGLAFFGWRGLGVWGLIIAGAMVGRLVLKRFRTYRDTPDTVPLIIDAILLGFFFPATLFDTSPEVLAGPRPDATWPALIGMGVLLAIFEWLALWQKRVRFHPVAITVALLAIAVPTLCHSDRVLTPKHMLGDVLDEHTEARSTASAEPWIASETDPKSRTFAIAPADLQLNDYLHGTADAMHGTQTMSRLVSDDLPPLEDLVIGGHPRRIGCASAIALLIGGLFLIYRGYVVWRVPMLALLVIYVTLLVLPVPVTVSPEAISHCWLAISDGRVGVGLGLTFVNYVIVVSPLLLVTFFLATRPGLRPTDRRMTCLFAMVYGIVAAAMTVFVSVSYGAIFALIIAQAIFGKRQVQTGLGA